MPELYVQDVNEEGLFGSTRKNFTHSLQIKKEVPRNSECMDVTH